MSPFKFMFDSQHLLTPFAIEHFKYSKCGRSVLKFKVIYIFGVRIAYWNTGKLD